MGSAVGEGGAENSLSETLIMEDLEDDALKERSKTVGHGKLLSLSEQNWTNVKCKGRAP